MLQLGSGMQTIEGVTVFPDHADEEQYWYLPAHLEIARRPSDDWPQFSFIKYKHEVTPEGVAGGGFLMFTVALMLPEEIERKVRAAIPASARLTAVPFDSGSVECVALNLQGPGGTTATVSAEGTFTAVQTILGARVPSLFGDNNALFSLTLSQEGATLLEAAFAQGAAPIGVIYTLTFTAMQPSLDVKITADFERIYKHFSVGLNANLYYVEIGIQAGIEKLVQEGAITIEVTTFGTASDKQDQEKAAIEFFTQHLLSLWFTPTLTPGVLQGGMATAPHATGTSVFGQGDKDKKDGVTRAGPTGDAKRANPPSPPAPGGGAARPANPSTPRTGGGAPTNPAGPPSPGAPTNPAAPPTPGTTAGSAAPASPATTADRPAPANPVGRDHDLTVVFMEEGASRSIPGVYTLGYQTDDAWHDTVTRAGDPGVLRVTLPSTWNGWLSAEITSLPELTLADAGSLRAHATTGAAVTASGSRATEANQSMEEITLPVADPLTVTVRIPVTKTVVTAGSPDALVAAVFPDGQLVQPGVFDCRRIAGTRDFELIAAGWPAMFETPTGGN